MTTQSPAHERVLETLEQVRAQTPGADGPQWGALCPAHDDRRASLRIGTGREGQVLLTCRAGCDPEAIVAAIGLEIRHLFNPEDGAPARSDGRNGTGRKAIAPIAALPNAADLERWRHGIDTPQARRLA